MFPPVQSSNGHMIFRLKSNLDDICFVYVGGCYGDKRDVYLDSDFQRNKQCAPFVFFPGRAATDTQFVTLQI